MDLQQVAEKCPCLPQVGVCVVVRPAHPLAGVPRVAPSSSQRPPAASPPRRRDKELLLLRRNVTLTQTQVWVTTERVVETP